MRRKFLTCALIVAALTASAASQAAPEAVRLLVVDETKTFASTLRVTGLVKALKGVGLYEIDVEVADVVSSYDDPLDGLNPDPASESYDLMLIIPRGLDDGSVATIWIVSDGLLQLAAHVRAGVELLSALVDQVFTGIGRAVDVYEDLFPGFFWALYVNQGWMR
jgi:hypothetical protein